MLEANARPETGFREPHAQHELHCEVSQVPARPEVTRRCGPNTARARAFLQRAARTASAGGAANERMEPMEMLRMFAAATTVIAAIMVAANWSARVMVAGFGLFIVASIAWMLDGWLENKASLLIQNAILLLVNIAGVWRWLPRASAEANGQESHASG
jgi:hypothetical protein